MEGESGSCRHTLIEALSDRRVIGSLIYVLKY